MRLRKALWKMRLWELPAQKTHLVDTGSCAFLLSLVPDFTKVMSMKVKNYSNDLYKTFVPFK